MFIELHRPDPITININKIDYFVPTDEGNHTIINVPNKGWIHVEESYEQVKELIEECQKR